MTAEIVEITGNIVRGFGIASGKSSSSPYPVGSIELQKPFFLNLGLDLTSCFNGTINVDTSPLELVMTAADYQFNDVKWTDIIPPETFSFQALTLQHKNIQYRSYWYLPHPETKPMHIQSKHTVELICPLIPDLEYGDSVTLILDVHKVITASS